MKTGIVLKREYFSRVKKKSFIIMTLLTPLLLAAVAILYSYFIFAEDTEEKKIGIIDESMVVFESLKNSEYTKFELLSGESVDDQKTDFDKSGFYAILYIPENIMQSERVKLYSDKQPSQAVIMYIQGSIRNYLEDIKIIDEGISRETLKSLKVNLSLDTIKWTEDGDEVKSSTGISMVVGYISGLMIYMFIFMYGVQVMRGVIEEKTNRIVEVIVSSVKPFQLMLGKIIGIALVGLTQFVAWIVLVGVFTWIGFMAFGPDYDAEQIVNEQAQSVLSQTMPVQGEIEIDAAEYNKYQEMFITTTSSIPVVTIIICFLLYFIGGYLLYAALFAAVGSAVDNETDVQQFMLPVTVPLILSILVMVNAIQNPEGSIAFWFSIIPLTSPIVMLTRIPFGVPFWQLALSLGLLILTFLAITYVAGRIYKTGILMYGKKVSYKELWKWIRYSG
jgi:ABC-2 type transport system permease protein